MLRNLPQILDGTRLQEYLQEKVEWSTLAEPLEISETTKFYVVDLLTRFERTEHLFTAEPLAMMYARAMRGDAATQVRELKKIGDTALWNIGFFSEHLQKGIVSMNYYMDMGSGAYSALSAQLASEDVFANLYHELSENFYGLTNVLKRLAAADHVANNSELLQLYERYLKTGDESIRELLIKEGMIPTRKNISC